MFVTPAAKLSALLPIVVSGGRPKLARRATHHLLPALDDVTARPVWIVREDQAEEYEDDGHAIITYRREDAEAYAAEHWFGFEPFRPGGFLGAFYGREVACRYAEQHDYWGVLQLDDNIRQLNVAAGYRAGAQVAHEAGGLACYADLLGAVTLSTNSRMTGAALSTTNPAGDARFFAKPGFPYSLFVEQVGLGREHWYGPFEDDILHAYQYAVNPTNATAAIVYPIKYHKDFTDTSGGMRAAYAKSRRSVGLQRMAPEMAELVRQVTTSNGRGEGRLFHRMRGGAIRARSPLQVHDRELYEAARTRAGDLVAATAARIKAELPARLARRAGATQ